ncbi:MAG: 2-dehydropantoate 2-reductase [Terriglobales bacterium]
MRHVILGAGGVGGLLAACLARAGEEVALVVRPEALASHPPKLHLDSPFGSWDVDVTWAASIPPADVLWLTVKATQLESAIRLIGDTGTPGAIVPLLNGLDHLPRLRSKFGLDRVIPATIAAETERVSAGHIVHSSPFAILNIAARGRTLLQPVIDPLRRIGFACNFIDDETTLMWTKLVFLGPFALATSAFGKPIGEVIADAGASPQLEECVRETCAAGQAEGAKVDAETVLKQMKGAPPAMRSSMQKDVDHGRPPELDAIGGAIVRAARRHGLKSSATEELMAQIERRITSRPVS